MNNQTLKDIDTINAFIQGTDHVSLTVAPGERYKFIASTLNVQVILS